MFEEDSDEDESLDGILKSLSGEVDDYAAKDLPEPSSMKGGATITITVSPQGISDKGPEDEENAGGIDKESQKEEEEDEPHDPIAHILGLCGGGCTGR